jgi:TRAP transporter TAXI family solute receptor
LTSRSLRKALKRVLGVGLALSLLAAGAPLAAQDDLRFVTLGSASTAGSYYAAASAICDSVNRSYKGSVRCSPEPTKGSIYNLRSLMRGDQDFAIVQSDWQKLAVEGLGPFSETGPFSDLRSVMALFPEAVTLVVRKGSGITGLEDLRGKRVDVGSVATARRTTALKLLEAAGLKREDLAQLAELAGSSVGSELCAGSIDASILLFGHPNALLGRLLSSCDLQVVPLRGDSVERFLASNSDFQKTYIPIGDYSQLAFDVETIALAATLVTRSDIPAPLVYTFATEILVNLDRISQEAPVIRAPDIDWMRSEGLSAELHPGAVAAFDSLGSN